MVGSGPLGIFFVLLRVSGSGPAVPCSIKSPNGPVMDLHVWRSIPEATEPTHCSPEQNDQRHRGPLDLLEDFILFTRGK